LPGTKTQTRRLAPIIATMVDLPACRQPLSNPRECCELHLILPAPFGRGPGSEGVLGQRRGNATRVAGAPKARNNLAQGAQRRPGFCSGYCASPERARQIAGQFPK
jgi:hypothetical protein